MLDDAGFDVQYRLGHALPSSILKRETDLLRRGVLAARLSSLDVMHEPAAIRWLASVLTYPTTEDVDRSYTMIAVATKTLSGRPTVRVAARRPHSSRLCQPVRGHPRNGRHV